MSRRLLFDVYYLQRKEPGSAPTIRALEPTLGLTLTAKAEGAKP